MNEKIIFEEEEEIESSEKNDNNNDQEELQVLRSQLREKSDLLDKSQNENKNLKKTCKELSELVKKKNTKSKSQKINNNDEDLLKWKCTWEKVITQMTEIIPYVIPKETNPEQQRKILSELTNRLCRIARNSTETIEYQNLKMKYERNKKKLIKLKEQCNSLLDIIQSKKRQSNYINQKYYEYDEDPDIFYVNDNEFSKKQRITKNKFDFNAIHDDIIINNSNKKRKDSPLIQNQQYSESKIVQKNYIVNSKSKILKEKSNINFEQQNFVKKIPENQIKKSRENYKNENLISQDKNRKNISKSNNDSKNIISPQKQDLAFSNVVIIDIESEMENKNISNETNDDVSISNNSKEKILKENIKNLNDQIQNSEAIQNSKETLNTNFQSNQVNSNNLNEINAIIDQEISDNEAEKVLSELESMKSSNTNNKIQRKSSEKHEKIEDQNLNENYDANQDFVNKKYSKKAFASYKIKQGRNMNELIDVTNKLREQYYQVSKRFGHTNFEFSKENDITFIQDSLLD